MELRPDQSRLQGRNVKGFAPKPKAAATKVRTRIMRDFGVDMPATARAIFGVLLAAPRPLTTMSLAVASLPPTVNHMYVTGARGQRRLSQETLDFRELVALAVGSRRFTWKPTGAVTAVAFFLSPHWVTKRHELRDMDVDNRLKPLFDALQAATGVPDYTNWEIHCYKVASSATRTVVYLFDVGELIDVYP